MSDRKPDFSDYADRRPTYTPVDSSTWQTVAFAVATPFIILLLITISVVVLTVTFIGRVTGLLKPDPGSYQDGTRPVPTDEEEFNSEIEKLLEQANRGYAYAQIELGALYEAGFAHARNYPEALRWYRTAASQGDPHAQFKLGQMFDFGFGVKQDEVQALMWCELAREFQSIGNAPEDHNLTDNIDRVVARLRAKMTESQIEEAMAKVEESFGKLRE